VTDDFRRAIRVITDFRPGVPMFDAAPLLADRRLFAAAVEALAVPFVGAGVDVVVGVEARGFYYAPPLAVRLGAGFVPARKPGKLPGATRAGRATATDAVGVVGPPGGGPVGGVATYPKAYEFEIQDGFIPAGTRVLVADDLLAKGGSALACCDIAEGCGATVVGCSFLLELVGLGGRDRLKPRPVYSLVPVSGV
jgi:adenine phosphoribosyltransferase